MNYYRQDWSEEMKMSEKIHDKEYLRIKQEKIQLTSSFYSYLFYDFNFINSLFIFVSFFLEI